MKTLRAAVAVTGAILLTLGYIASQIAAIQGQGAAADYAAKVDQPSIRALALVLLVAALILSCLPDREAKS